jgi:hypothetical protein
MRRQERHPAGLHTAVSALALDIDDGGVSVVRRATVKHEVPRWRWPNEGTLPRSCDEIAGQRVAEQLRCGLIRSDEATVFGESHESDCAFQGAD